MRANLFNTAINKTSSSLYFLSYAYCCYSYCCFSYCCCSSYIVVIHYCCYSLCYYWYLILFIFLEFLRIFYKHYYFLVQERYESYKSCINFLNIIIWLFFSECNSLKATQIYECSSLFASSTLICSKTSENPLFFHKNMSFKMSNIAVKCSEVYFYFIA